MRVAGSGFGARRARPFHPEHSMSRNKAFDPHAIPNYAGAGRVGEIDPNEPEEQMSSAQIAGSDPDVQTDPDAAAAPADAAEGRDAERARERAAADDAPGEDPGEPVTRASRDPASAEPPRTQRDDRARGQAHNPTDNPEPVTAGPGGIDGLVGAP
jgi:hypothetical protein